MNARFLLDTNVLSEPVMKNPNQAVMQRLKQHQTEVATAALVWHELIYGCARLSESNKKQILQKYLAEVVGPSVIILPYDEAAAAWHGRERARLSSIGKTPPFVDGQIAAVAAVNDLILVTRNTSDFEQFAGLTIENWFEDK